MDRQINIPKADSKTDGYLSKQDWQIFSSGAGTATWGSITGTLSSQTDLQTALNTKEDITNKGIPNGYASLDAFGKVPLSEIPASLINDTYVVNSQAAMLALPANVGDVAIRTDINETFILQSLPANIFANWVQFLNAMPWGTITGVLSAQTDLQSALNAKVNLAGDTMTGGLTIGIANTVNQTALTINQNDVTNNPAGIIINNAGTGNDITATNWDIAKTGIGTLQSLLLPEQLASPSAPANNLALHTMDHQGITALQATDSTGFMYELGEDSYYIGRNTTASPITKGQVVCVTGATGVTPDIGLAKSDSLTTLRACSVAAEAIPVNGFGRCFIIGVIENFNTSAFSIGDVLYVSPTTAGGFTNTKPTNPDYAKKIGTVLVSGIGNGTILIRVAATFGEESGTNNVFTAPNFISSVAIGTQPYAATSTTLNTNLNADLLDGQHASAFQTALTIGNLTDAGTDGITITGGTGAVIGAGTSLSQHVSDSTHNGYLSSTDWSTFNAKQSALTIGNITDAGTDGITITGGTGAIIGSGVALSQHVADTTHNGYLSSTDWNTFNTASTVVPGYVRKQTVLTGSGTNSFTISSLSLDTDFVYDIVLYFKMAAADRMYMRFNGDSGAHYGYENTSRAVAGGAAAQDSIRISNASATIINGIHRLTVARLQSGEIVSVTGLAGENAGTNAIGYDTKTEGSWDQTANLTSITFTTTATGGGSNNFSYRCYINKVN